jgi:hypothetical protein
VISIIFLIIFLLGLGFFGWQIVRFVFKIDHLELLLPLSLATGYGVYTFFLNIFSYFVPITLNFYLIFVLLLIIGFILFFSNRGKTSLKSELTKKDGLIILGIVSIVMILSGLIAYRTIEADDLAYPHLPLASSIAGGNFPVKNPNLPNYDLAIHYGPSLFYAAISKVTGLSILTSFRIVIFLFSGIVLLLLFNIAKLFIKHNLGSFFVGLVGFLGGGFRFIYGFDGLITLYKKFILHYNIGHPFGFLGEMWSVSPLSGPLVVHIFNNWFVFGWVLALAVIYLYLKIINSKIQPPFCDILIIILLSVLALTFEMGFIVICFGIFVVPFIFYFKNKNKEDFRIMLKHSLLILVITAIFVLFQGGVITVMLRNIIQHTNSYGVDSGLTIFKNPLAFDLGNGMIFPFYSLTFILNFGLIYFLIIPAIIFMVKKNFKESIFLAVVSCFSFLLPLFISFKSWVWQGTMDRFFRFGSAIWAIMVGLFLVIVFFQPRNKEFFKKVIIFICLVTICLDGAFFLLTKPFYTRIEYRLNNSKFFAILRPLSTTESAAYKWIEKNSNIKDYFLVFADKNDIDNQASVMENFRFVIFAQRLAPIYTQSNNYIDQTLPIDNYYTPVYKRVTSGCIKDDIKILNYRYLFVDNNWSTGLEEKCLANNNLELKFETEKEDKFIRIYEVK